MLALATLYIFSMPFVGNLLVRCLEARYSPVQVERVQSADAIVALSGFLGPPASAGCLLNVSEAGERLEGAITLWQRGKAPWLVFTGARIPWEKDLEAEGEVAMRAAVARGVPAGQIIVTGPVGDTNDEARELAVVVLKREWKRIILVTSAAHMRRAALLFRRAHVQLIPFPVDYRIDPHRPHTLLDFLPNAEALQKSESAIRELYGTIYYSLTIRD